MSYGTAGYVLSKNVGAKNLCDLRTGTDENLNTTTPNITYAQTFCGQSYMINMSLAKSTSRIQQLHNIDDKIDQNGGASAINTLCRLIRS
jgi:hypothetical protein